MAKALWYIRRGVAEIKAQDIMAPRSGEAVVKTLWSGISRGTERLVFNGLVAAPERERMRCPMQEGDFPFPVKYGYCAVGEVTDGPDALKGKTVFALHPHQDVFLAPLAMLHGVPDAVPARRAILAANMETALNGVWDSGVGPGDRVVVVGAGIVGLLIAALCAQIPGCEVTLVDIDQSRKRFATLFGCRFAKPIDAPGGADVTFHASATSAGLACALACAGDEARVVEMSWFGDHDPAVPLGAGFHAKRLQIISSQVGMVATSRRARWSYGRRLAKALELLADPRYDELITAEMPFADLPSRLPELLAPGAAGLATAIHY